MAALGISQAQAPGAWYSAQSGTVDGMQQVELDVARNIVARAKSLQDGAQRSALLTAILTTVILLLVLILTVVVARTLVGPLRRLREGALIPEARLAEMNWRLDNPPVIDVSVARHMGLFAVARLAERHGVRVRLRSRSPRGLTALVWLPDSVTEPEAGLYGTRPRVFAPQAGVQAGFRADLVGWDDGGRRLGPVLERPAWADQDREHRAAERADRDIGGTD
ncbi:MAG: ATP-binding protein [Streptosporangiaceae bacterium]